MALFKKIKITPIVVEKDWKITYTNNSRVEKQCHICRKQYPIGYFDMTTFLKRSKVAARDSYETLYTCGHNNSPCTKDLANRLNLTLP